jgi:hypothetical protein
MAVKVRDDERAQQPSVSAYQRGDYLDGHLRVFGQLG